MTDTDKPAAPPLAFTGPARAVIVFTDDDGRTSGAFVLSDPPATAAEASEMADRLRRYADWIEATYTDSPEGSTP